MKILHVINSLSSGGAEKLVVDFANFQSRDDEVVVFTFNNKNNLFHKHLESRVTFIHYDETSFLSIKKWYKLSQLMREADVVHCHLFPAFYIVALLSFVCRCTKLVFTEHNTENKRRRNKLIKPIERFIYSRYDNVICISKSVEQSLNNWLTGLSTSIIYNAIDLDKFKNAEVADSIDVNIDAAYLIMVGRFEEMKDQITVLKALNLLPNNFHLILIGNGRLKPLIEQEIVNLSLENRVIIKSFRSDVANILKLCKYGVLSSRWEGFGIVALEYMAASLIALGTNVPGLNEVIPVQKNLFSVGDYKNLAQRILEIEDNKLEASILKHQNETLEPFDIETAISKYLEVYQSK
jgi:glycosyltransferase involved in cell wall biosynthesis